MIELRPYQKKLISGVYEHYHQKNRKVLLQLPTGGGKSLTCSQIIGDAVEKQNSVFVIAHRNELIQQMQHTLARVGIHSGIIKAGVKPTASRVQIASIQSLARRLHKYRDFNLGLIVIDECHHITSGNQYKTVLDAYPNAFVLGLTATPTRLDGKGLGDIFQELVHGPQLHELVDQGFLVPPSYFVGASVTGDRALHTKMGDYNVKEMGEAVSELRLEGDLVAEWRRHADGLQTVVFAVNVAHSEAIVDAYAHAGIPAAHLDGATPGDTRKRILADFAAKRIKVLSNVGIVTEGFDVPEIGCVQLARPTQSVSLYYQMVGRALRPAPGKTEAIILDHAGCYDTHGNVLTPYYWSLKGTKPKEARANWDESDDEPAEKKERIITHDGKEVLVKISFDLENAWIDELKRLQRVCAEREYKPGWIAHRMLERFGQSQTREQFRLLAKVCGYHWKWADRKFELQEKAIA